MLADVEPRWRLLVQAGGPTPSPGKASKAQAVPLVHPLRASSTPLHCTLTFTTLPRDTHVHTHTHTHTHTRVHTVTHSHPQPLPT